MNPSSDQLALRDIHLPDPVSWWPPAPGWWILLALVIVLLMLVPPLLKKLRHKPAHKLALIELQNIRHNYAAQQDKTQLVQDISILLRRTCMSYGSRQQSASVTGDAWIQQLNALSENAAFSEDMARLLLTAPYSKNSDIDADALLHSCQQWLLGLARRKNP